MIWAQFLKGHLKLNLFPELLPPLIKLSFTKPPSLMETLKFQLKVFQCIHHVYYTGISSQLPLLTSSYLDTDKFKP